jgi:2-polyprenyl-3-methyl-5-hydroxy-6-metoxy-1,4-benzoquinol methylase
VNPVVDRLGDKKIPANLRDLLDQILEENPLHLRFIQSALGNITGNEMSNLAQYLEFCAYRGLKIDYLAECYLTIVEDTLSEQRYFMLHNEYRHKTFSDVAGAVYFDDEYMHRYMYGLALTSFLWPNHLAMARFFQQTLPLEKAGKYLEIGPGHGYFLMMAMKNSAFDEFLGVDISEASIKQTREISEYFLPDLNSRLELREMDFLAADQLDNEQFAAIIMGEVLEHVEQPEKFLRRIYDLARSDTHIYITTCINAPAVDHIYLWRNTVELEEMILGCGLGIKKSLYLPYEGKSLKDSVTERLAVNVAYILEKSL